MTGLSFSSTDHCASVEEKASSEIYATITDTIFAVLMTLSFEQYAWLLAPPVPSIKLVMLFLAYLVIVLSRVGYHRSIRDKPYRGSKRFLVDLWILYSYFLLLSAPGSSEKSSPNVLLMAESLVGVFAGYVVWDYLKMKEHVESELRRALISVFCFAFSIYMFFLFLLPLNFGPSAFLGEPIRDWIFVTGGYAIAVFFWYPKERLFKR